MDVQAVVFHCSFLLLNQCLDMLAASDQSSSPTFGETAQGTAEPDDFLDKMFYWRKSDGLEEFERAEAEAMGRYMTRFVSKANCFRDWAGQGVLHNTYRSLFTSPTFTVHRARTLLQHGADPCLLSDEGKTPTDLALQLGREGSGSRPSVKPELTLIMLPATHFGTMH